MKNVLLTLVFLISCMGATTAQNYDLQNNKPHDAIVFPNPMVGNILKINSFNKIKTIEIRNIIGQVVYYSKQPISNIDNQYIININIKHEGIYFITLSYLNKKNIIKRLLVK